MNNDYELFVWEGTTAHYSDQMKSIDKKLPPVSTMEKGPKTIRAYWNNKNLRKRVSVN